jgi:hypothetical protein
MGILASDKWLFGIQDLTAVIWSVIDWCFARDACQ